MTQSPLRTRRVLVRLALLFAVAQLIAAASVLFALPALRAQPLGVALLIVLGLVDLALLALFAGWVVRGSLSGPVERLASDVQRIADGDFNHRVSDTHRSELRAIEESVNRLADRVLADQSLLAENILSLDDTNRELVLLRDQMIHSARLASVGTLAAGIAHEVGNPLGAITGFVDVARKRAQRAGHDTELLDSIRGEAARIDRIVRGLLDYARPRGAETAPARARDVVVGVRDLLESQGRLEDADFSWELGDGAGDYVLEPHRLQQVLVNLLLNALDAVEGVEEARIFVRLLEAPGKSARLPPRREDDPPGVNYMHRRRLSDDERRVDLIFHSERVTVIEVADNGPGIPDEDLNHVFDPFFTTKEPGKGTGLGLAICARLVEGMGGTIEVARASEGGARFVVRLPGMTGAEAATLGTQQVDSRANGLEQP
ncbi:MAG TPA: ATP-binding protein [Longimicrobiales bacterium]|nr:ATP-binding protein [Longimicrobiales bacterium]